MAYIGENEHVEYLRYVEQWSMGEGEHSNDPKMSKEEWRKRRKKDEESARNTPESILGAKN